MPGRRLARYCGSIGVQATAASRSSGTTTPNGRCNQRWYTGWLEEQPEKPVKVFPDPDSYIGSRDLDAASAVWAALEEAGLDPKTYFREVPQRGLLAETPES